MKEDQIQSAGAILSALLGRVPGQTALAPQTLEAPPAEDRLSSGSSPDTQRGHFDFDLAEFPLFRFHKNRMKAQSKDPLRYTDVIRGKDGPVTREWMVYPGPFGFGGQSTQTLLFDLLQLYVEQGCLGTQIQFGTLRSLFMRRGERNPSKRDYDRMRRDLDILLGYLFQCKNAFWDRRRQAYVDMKWRLFTAVFFFKERPDDDSVELPFGFIEVSPVLQRVAQPRGFFSIGFDGKLFYGLKPLEQRLAVYIAKKFISQKLHRRFVADLARALPIEAARPDNVRTILQKTAQGLLDKRVPILESFALEKSRNGQWLAVFRRRAASVQDVRLPHYAAVSLAPGVADTVQRIIEATGNAEDRLWWAQCAKRLGRGPVDRALGQLKEACQYHQVRNRGALPGPAATKSLRQQ